MGILTKQKLALYYELFKAIDVTFSKEIIQVTGLVTNQVYLKCVGDFWPCVIFSSSFQGAKVVVNTKSGILQKLERANNMISLRFCFKVADKGNPVAFSVNTKSTGYSPYGGSVDMALFNLQFTQRPPDDLIEIMGRILDANVNSTKRREERIPITPDTARKLSIAKESSIFIQGVPRHCILRDIAFSGVKIIMMGVAKFLVDREAVLKIDFDDPKECFLMKGKFIRSEVVEGRKELVSLVVHFEENIVPMGYKIRINDFVSQLRVENRGAEKVSDMPGIPSKPMEEKPTAQSPLPPPPSAPPKKKEEAKPHATDDPAPIDDSFDLDLPT